MFDKAINGAITATLTNRENALNREGSYKPLEPQTTYNQSDLFIQVEKK